MVWDLADSATLGGAVALSTSGTRATSGGIQTTMAYEEFDEATVAYILWFIPLYTNAYEGTNYVVSFHFQVKSPAEILEHAQDANSR